MSIYSEAGDTLWHTGFQMTDRSLGTDPEKDIFPPQLVQDVLHFLVNTFKICIACINSHASEICMSCGVCAGLSNKTVCCAKTDRCEKTCVQISVATIVERGLGVIL